MGAALDLWSQQKAEKLNALNRTFTVFQDDSHDPMSRIQLIQLHSSFVIHGPYCWKAILNMFKGSDLQNRVTTDP